MDPRKDAELEVFYSKRLHDADNEVSLASYIFFQTNCV